MGEAKRKEKARNRVGGRGWEDGGRISVKNLEVASASSMSHSSICWAICYLLFNLALACPERAPLPLLVLLLCLLFIPPYILSAFFILRFMLCLAYSFLYSLRFFSFVLLLCLGWFLVHSQCPFSLGLFLLAYSFVHSLYVLVLCICSACSFTLS